MYIEPSKMTVGQWLDVWHKEYKMNNLKPRTNSNYHTIIFTNIIPILGEYKLESLKTDIFQNFVNELLEKGMKASTMISIFTVLKSSLQQAVDNNLISKNPALNVKLPKKQKKKLEY